MADVGKKLFYYTGPGAKIHYQDIGDGYYAQTMAVMGPNTRVIRVNPTVSATPNYGIDDVIGGKMVITDIATRNGKGGIINSVVMTSKVDIPAGVTVDVLFFDTDPTNSTFTDNAVLSVNVADLPALLPGVAQLTTRIDLGTAAALTAHNLGIPVDTLTTDNLWAVAVIRGAGTLDLGSTSDIQFVFGFLPD